MHKAHGPAHKVKAHIWVCIFIPWPTSIPSSSGFCICVIQGWGGSKGYLDKDYMWLFLVRRIVKKRKKKKEIGSCILMNREKWLPPLREIISVCVWAKKNKRDFSLAVRHSQKIIVIDLIIVKLSGVCPMVFPFKEKGFST